MFERERIERTRGGSVALRLPDGEQELLRALLAELRALLGDGEAPELRRLFPPAYDEDDEREPEYRSLMRGELVSGRLADARAVERTVAASTLDDDELEAWLRTLNDLRLVLGTRLDVTEDPYERGQESPELALYAYLSWLQEQAVEASGSHFR